MTVAGEPFELHQVFQDAFNSGDLETVLGLYEPDAVLMPGPEGDPLRGLDQIRCSLEGFLELDGRLTFTPRHWLVNGDLALASISCEMHDAADADGNPVQISGVTSELLRRQPDGGWRYVVNHPFGGTA